MKAKTKTALFVVISAVLFYAIVKVAGGTKEAFEFIKKAFKGA